MEEVLKSLFEKQFGEVAEKILPLKGDGSNRKIYRLSNSHRSVIGITNPDRRENQAFLGFSRHFRDCNLPVPSIFVENQDQTIYLEEDLGDLPLFKFLSENRGPEGLAPAVIEIYRQVVELLPRFQIQAGKNLNYRICYPRASFDKQSMMWDLNYFKYYFLRLSQIPFNEQELENDFEKFTRYLLSANRNFFLYRDFQSRNVMLKEGKPYFIDYQGGRKGALQYDIASLLYDAKADLPFELRDVLLERYIEAAGKLIPLDRTEFLNFFPGYVFIRILQALGAYGLRGFYEKKTHFLQSIPYAIRNIEYLLRSVELPVELPALMQIFKSLVASSLLRQYGNADLKLTVRIQSFSYKKGLPSDERGHGGGYVFDCRALPNPGRLPEFSQKSGIDPAVVQFLEKEEEVHRYLRGLYSLIDQSVENYQKRNFTDLMVSFGCTGGQHRSVYCATQLAKHLREKYPVDVELRHRELEKIQDEG
jgi:aminoglycoside/choline kinase family phosphotransferase